MAVSRGFSTNLSIDQLVKLKSSCKLVPLLGNHDAMLLAEFGDEGAYGWRWAGSSRSTRTVTQDSFIWCLPSIGRFFEAADSTTRLTPISLCMPTTITSCLSVTDETIEQLAGGGKLVRIGEVMFD